MSDINIKAFFKFSKVKAINQKVDIQSKTVSIKVEPDKRYTHTYAIAVMILLIAFILITKGLLGTLTFLMQRLLYNTPIER